MLTGLYSAASGMMMQERVQDVIAQNLAGSQMPGFRREEAVIRSFPDVMLSETYRGIAASQEKPRYNHAIGRVGTGAGIDWVYVDHTPGQMQYTGEETNAAIFGDGFFNVQTPDGLRYTRAGDFLVDNEGYLVSKQGYYVMGVGVNNDHVPEPIQVGDNEIYINQFGEIYHQQQPAPGNQGPATDVLIDQLKITDFHDKDKLFREPGNIFRAEEDDLDNFKIPDYFRVGQGYIERANTEPTTEMVKMIDSYRTFEASSRVLRALDDTLQKAVNDVARM